MTTKKTKKSKSIDLFKEVMPAIDQDGKDIWDLLSDEQKKEIRSNFWILNRYISSVAKPKEAWQTGKSPSSDEVEHFVESVNEFYNKNWSLLQQHPALVWKLLCMCSHETKSIFYHEYIPIKKEQDKKTNLLLELFPNTKRNDIETLASITTNDEIRQHLRDLGWDQEAINKLKL